MSSDLSQPFPQIFAPLTNNRDAEGKDVGYGRINQIWLQLLITLWNRTGAAGGISTEEALLMAVANEDLHRQQQQGDGLALMEQGGGGGGSASANFLSLLVHETVVRVIEGMDFGAPSPLVADPALAELFSLPSAPGTFESGYYTPTLTNVTNLAASTAFSCQYLRVRDTVTVSGRVDVDPTAAGATALGISLPIPSNFSAAEQCAGTAAAPAVAGQCAAILADAANNRAEMDWIAVDLTNQPMYFSFTYRMI